MDLFYRQCWHGSNCCIDMIDWWSADEFERLEIVIVGRRFFPKASRFASEFRHATMLEF